MSMRILLATLLAPILLGATSTDTATVTTTNPVVPTGLIDMSIVPTDRQTVWNPGIYGGIPPDDANASTFPNGVGPALKQGDTLTPSGGDDTAQIQAAINAAAAVPATKAIRRYVLLGAGTFQLAGSLSIPSYVILRGTLGASNARQTILNVTQNTQNPIVLQGSHSGVWGTIYQVQGTLKRGDSTITLDTVAGLSVGDLIKLDHLSDGARSGQNALTFRDITINGTVTPQALTAGMSRDWDDTPTSTGAAVFGNSSLSFTRADHNNINFAFQFFPDSDVLDANVDNGWRHISETK